MPVTRALARALAALAFVALAAPSHPAGAQEREPSCPPMVAERGGARIHLASLAANEVALTFVGHATFLIESPAGISIATDYNDFVRPAEPPTIATMNRAHRTHYTDRPDPRIAHVLRGWGTDGAAAAHDLSVGDVRVRNVPTNLRSGLGTDFGGNSIFVFEVAGLCVAHLGHLHHVLEPEHLIALGRVDVALAPVDGSYTLDTAGMLETLRRIGPKLVVPMHFFSQARLDAFLEEASAFFAVERSDTPSLTLARETLPTRTTVLALPGR